MDSTCDLEHGVRGRRFDKEVVRRAIERIQAANLLIVEPDESSGACVGDLIRLDASVTGMILVEAAIEEGDHENGGPNWSRS